MEPMLLEVWTWLKVAVTIYGVVAAVVLVLALVFIVLIFRKLMRDF